MVQALPVVLFILIVSLVLAMSFYFARKAKSASGYYAAGGSIHWGVNGIAFAGDYLSAASFLGICGMIATAGYDGFLYSIGYLAGWIVALFIVAEPLKRLGKYTFTDAIDSKFNSKGIKLMAAISTLVVSLFYLIPQMVGAGVLVTPLLGLPHYVGVIMVGIIVITIVATAGMTSTTYVQFIKGALLIVFSTILVVGLCVRGLSTTPDQGGQVPFHDYVSIPASRSGDTIVPADASYRVQSVTTVKGVELARLEKSGLVTWWQVETVDGSLSLRETQSVVTLASGERLVNGRAESADNRLALVGNMERIDGQTGEAADTGPISPFRFLALIGSPDSTIRLWKEVKLKDGDDKVSVYYDRPVSGNRIMRPGLSFKVEGTPLERIDFISLMIALFLGTAALPHILIRYYTVPSPKAARKSTIVAIAAIGAFYILTLFMGLGAMTNGVVNLADNNMSAPLLARSFGTFLFSMISAIAFATVLGTVSGLIIAASGAVAHDLMDRFGGIIKDDKHKVRAGKVAAFVVGALAIVLGILFKGQNVSFLVGLAFAVAASANLPSIVMMLFWKRTTSKGISASILVGILSSIGLILLSPTMFELFGLDPASAPFPLKNPGIVSIPLSFITIVVVSLLTKADQLPEPGEKAALLQKA
ncbi:MAG: cation acetate symporter [Spirochaetes bacterium GWD1_61_31]|nr:MAG: cation acetate symporter [Spirochaetes bacterium GWB1_60_80]OHD30822.1 MAG: cation acetate symporter [Spirochaetes bacterium GWC1_61_12]OHD37373.1 MAG: cation acetate symporter [Spirochaetes bacterium GWD1_61_31]OHD46322.1 MAG: cation acetate symporter [Spirochaetes bacterium GWE1_60_18]OHD60929.1 MAG: cation acetate symporter [Spirochaetes bacterium GWF1_60_12]HAP42813.1 cation acetate symporter [Spirochaetaceae bacterium]